MNKEEYNKYAKMKLKNSARKIMIEQIDRFYDAHGYKIPKH